MALIVGLSLFAPAVRAVPGGASLLPTQLYAGDGRHIGAVGLSDTAFAEARTTMTVTGGSLDGFDGTTMIVRAATSAWLGWTAGRSVPVTFEDGSTASVRVAAVITDNSSTASVLLPRRTVRRHAPDALTDVVHVPGTGRPDLPAALGAEAMSAQEYADRTGARDDRLVRIFLLILIGMSLGYTCLAIATTLLMATADRVPDLAVLRLSGATTGQVLRIVTAESALSVGVGTTLGLAVALIALLGVRSGLSARLGTDVSLNLPWPVMAVTIGLCLVPALLSSVVPARLALRAGI